MFFSKEHKYVELPDDEAQTPSSMPSPRERRTSTTTTTTFLLRHALLLALCFLAGSLGYLTTERLSTRGSHGRSPHHHGQQHAHPTGHGHGYGKGHKADHAAQGHGQHGQHQHAGHETDRDYVVEAEQLAAAGMNNTSNLIEIETYTHTFHYNSSFSRAPSPHTDAAWRALVPLTSAFFVHPLFSPQRATLSVFHQLHCLDAVRGAFWARQGAMERREVLDDAELRDDWRQSHVRHCVDLIRQVLLCHADATVEVVDERIGGVNGFHTAHECRRWDGLLGWVEGMQRKNREDGLG